MLCWGWPKGRWPGERVFPDSWKAPGLGGPLLLLEEGEEAVAARQAGAQALLQGCWEPGKVFKQEVVTAGVFVSRRAGGCRSAGRNREALSY